MIAIYIDALIRRFLGLCPVGSPQHDWSNPQEVDMFNYGVTSSHVCLKCLKHKFTTIGSGKAQTKE